MRVTREIGQRVNRRNDLKKKQLENPAKNLKLETNGSDNNGTTTVTNDKETEQNVNRNLEKNEKNNTEETKEKSVKMLKNEKKTKTNPTKRKTPDNKRRAPDNKHDKRLIKRIYRTRATSEEPGGERQNWRWGQNERNKSKTKTRKK